MMPRVQITFSSMQPSRLAEEWVRAEVAKLTKFCNDVAACHVAIEVPHRHKRKGAPYHVRVQLTVPGGEVVIERQPNLSKRSREEGKTSLTKRLEVETPHKNLQLAIHDAFRAAGRRLQGYLERRAGYVKAHFAKPSGRVRRLLPERACGFLMTRDGREIYFMRTAF